MRACVRSPLAWLLGSWVECYYWVGYLVLSGLDHVYEYQICTQNDKMTSEKSYHVALTIYWHQPTEQRNLLDSNLIKRRHHDASFVV